MPSEELLISQIQLHGNSKILIRWRAAMVLAATALVVAVIYRHDPSAPGLYPPCPFHAITGLNCPGCGSLRAMHQLLHGHFSAAFRFNPLWMLALPIFVYAILGQMITLLRGYPIPAPFVHARYIWILLGVILIYWILRNIPVYPFTLLAPYSGALIQGAL